MKDIHLEIIRNLRGKRSTAFISKQMGFSGNVVYKWETGKSTPSWPQFIDYCQIVDPQFLVEFQHYFKINGNYYNPNDVFISMKGDVPISHLTQHLNVSKSTVSRWISGELAPNFSIIIKIISMTGGQLISFLSHFEKFKNIPEVSMNLKSKNLFHEFPEAIVIWNIIDLEQYKQTTSESEDWISKKTLIDRTRVRTIISKMQDCGILTFDQGKLSHGQTPVCLGGKDEERIIMQKYWLQKAMDTLSSMSYGSIPVKRFNVFTTDQEGLIEIQKANADYLHRIGEIIDKSQSRPQEEVLLLLNFLVPLLDH